MLRAPFHSTLQNLAKARVKGQGYKGRKGRDKGAEGAGSRGGRVEGPIVLCICVLMCCVYALFFSFF